MLACGSGEGVLACRVGKVCAHFSQSTWLRHVPDKLGEVCVTVVLGWWRTHFKPPQTANGGGRYRGGVNAGVHPAPLIRPCPPRPAPHQPASHQPASHQPAPWLWMQGAAPQGKRRPW